MASLYSMLGLVALAVIVSADDLKIDFSCQSDFSATAWTELVDNCKLKMTNPLKRDCVEGCILEDLGLIALGLGANKTLRENGAGGGGTYVTLELEGLCSDNQEMAEALQASVEEKCGDIMIATIQTEEKNCEDWDPIFECIKEAACSANVEQLKYVFPDLRCHKGYKRGPSRLDHATCQKEKKNPLEKDCYEGCMLERFGIIEFSMTDEEATVQLGEIGTEEDGYYGNLAAEMKFRFDDNDEAALEIVKAIHADCKEIFDKTIVEDKLPCEEWTPLYDCIKTAVACKEE